MNAYDEKWLVSVIKKNKAMQTESNMDSVASLIASNTAKKSKYGNTITEIDGIKFDSKKEANRYCELLLLQKAGLISNLECQKQFVIQPKKGKIRAITYIADFFYIECDKAIKGIVEDVKPLDKRTGKYRLTSTFKNKWKQMQVLYPEYEYRIY
jgi:hypothetical protein